MTPNLQVPGGRPPCVLLVEDDPAIRSAVSSGLSPLGCRVLATDSLVSGWHLFRTEKPDLAILDMGLPDGSGADLCERIRNHKTLGKIPVIILTSRGEERSKKTGFRAGADQYLVKPISVDELVLWVAAALKRAGAERPDEPVTVDDVTVDLKGKTVTVGDVVVQSLTEAELKILYVLVKESPRVRSRAELRTLALGSSANEHVMDVHLSNLRGKLPPSASKRIQTIAGVGVRFLAFLLLAVIGAASA